MVPFYHNSWCYSFSHSQAGYRVDIIDHWSIFDHWSIIDLNGRYSWIFGRYCIKMVDISPKYLKMVIDFPYYLKYDKSQDFKVYSAIKWSHMKISTSTLYLLGSRIQSCPNKHAVTKMVQHTQLLTNREMLQDIVAGKLQISKYSMLIVRTQW